MRVTRTTTRAGALALTLAALGLACAAHAQSFRFVPSISLSETWSDNVALAGDELARDGWITDLIPGVRINANGARLKGYLDYRAHLVHYSNLSGADSTRHSLASNATLEAIEGFLFIDGRADISQQNRSPLAASVGVDSASASDNRIETRTFQLAPRAQGRISDRAVYQVRYTASHVSSEGDQVPDTRIGEFVGRVRNASLAARLGWAVDVYSLAARNDEIGTVDDSRARGLLIFGIDPLLNVSAIYGRETTDFAETRRSTNTYGAALNWQPSSRTRFTADVERRFFGTGHSAAVSYRTARTAWQLTSSRDTAVLPNTLSASSNSVYGLLADLLAPSISDPTARAEAARERLEETGIPSSFPLATGFVTSRPLIYGRQTATAALLGVRNTLTIRFTRLDQRGVAGFPSVTAEGADLRQTGVDASWAHKLTRSTTLTATATALRSEDFGIAPLTTRQDLFSLSLSTRLGPSTTASLGIRHARFDSPQPFTSYTENAVVGVLQLRL